MYKVTTASLSVESEVDTSQLQVMRPATVIRKAIIPVSQKIPSGVEMTIHCHKAHTLIDPHTYNVAFISATFGFLNDIPTHDINAKYLETAIKGTRSTMTK